ncbi:carbohydrate binding domain-containing protein [Bacillus marinisedimentorum]|uniref:carbohydrate binding domain-containing protein n=1 Tax=Bacillus marinisedimentorum TaxID=1821260 RepID=UPI0007E162CD|nr:carbohydrate binding domain-containing protein [Bacillus marinisedimentorum]
MVKKVVMSLLVFMLVLGVVLPAANAKETSNDANALIKKWEDRGLFSGVKNMAKNPNAAMSKAEFAAVIHNLFGYVGDQTADVVKTAKAAGYWDVVFGDNAKKNSVIKKEEAWEILNYFFPGGSTFAGDNQANSNAALKRIDAIRLIDDQVAGFYFEEGTYAGETIEGNALINHADITLQNTTVMGDLVVTEGAAPGNIVLKNVAVNGTVYIAEELQNNVLAIDSSLNRVVTYTTGQTQSDWDLVWSDEFIADEIDLSKWSYDIGNWVIDENGDGIAPGWGNNELQYYTDSQENSYIEDGKLVIEAKKEESPVTDEFGSYQYTSAKLKTKDLFSKKYGKFEAKMKLPAGKGYWPAFWMMPQNDVYGSWPASGEIDIMEAAGKDLSAIGGTIHFGEEYPNNTYKGAEYHFPEGEDITGFHTYSIEWEPGEIRWYVDGELYQTLDNWFSKGTNQADKFSFPAPFDQEFYMILNLAVGGWYGGNPDDTTQFPGKMEVDYVRAYELTGREYKEPVEPSTEKAELPEGAKMPLEDGNLIYDSDFAESITIVDTNGKALDALYWNFLHLPDFGGDGIITTEEIDGVTYARTAIRDAGNALWALQLIQKIAIAEGSTYKVSFDAKSDTNRTMMTKVSGGAERDYANYSGEQTVQLTDAVQPYEYTFTLNQETDTTARLEFNMGSNGNAPVWIGNVRIEEITPEDPGNASKTPLPDGNHIYNGTFDQGDMTRTAYWDLEVEDSAAAKASVDKNSRELYVAISEGGESPDSIKVKQEGIQLLKGNDYELAFDARSTEDRAIEVEFISEEGTASYSESISIDLTDQMEQHSVSFTMPTDVSDEFSQVLFKMGGHDGDVYLDNVKLLQTSEYIDYSEVDLYPLHNGDFSAGLAPWSSYVHFDADAVISEQDQALQVNIPNAGNETWSVLVEQGNLALAKGVAYELSFDARSTAERDMEITIENAGYHRYFHKVVPLSDEMNSHHFEWVMSADDTVSLKFLMGNFPEAHDITIDNVVLQVKGASELD